MSPAHCAYHPEQLATTTCTQCGSPCCDQCVEMVANKPVCRNCVSAIRARVASQMNTGAIPVGQSPIAATVPQGAAGPALLLGAVYGIVIGVVGAYLLAAFIEHTQIEIGYLNALVGFGVGYGILKADKRGGVAPAVVGGIIAFLAMMLSEYLLCGYYFALEAAKLNTTAPPITLNLFLAYLHQLGFLDWIIIAIGVYGGVTTPLRAQRRMNYTR